MGIFLIILHVVVCVALIMIVLLQTGKGADMGAAFGGGGSQTLFGSTGASTFLSKATTVAAIIFMLTSLVLAYLSSNRSGSTMMPQQKAPIEQPVQTEQSQTPASAPAATDSSGDQPAATKENTTE